MTSFLKTSSCSLVAITLALAAVSVASADMHDDAPINLRRPALVITDQPIPDHITQSIYRKPDAMPVINAQDVLLYDEQTQTLVTRKYFELQSDLSVLQDDVAQLTMALANSQADNQVLAADYHAAVATVRTQLQNGTTPGNPRLVRRLTVAENALEELGDKSVALNTLSMNAADAASKVNFLNQATRAAFDISGAVEEDHKKLKQLEDETANTAMIIERILNDVNDDILRMNTYLNVERQNLRTLSLAVSKGDMYGRSLSNTIYNSYRMPQAPVPGTTDTVIAPVVQDDITVSASDDAMAFDPPTEPPVMRPLSPESRLPLAKIMFDQPNVDFEQPVYAAVNEALQRYPDAVFDIVAVHPSEGNAAQVAIESTRARRNADKVLRSLSQMGIDLDRTTLSYEDSAEAQSSEVHIFVR